MNSVPLIDALNLKKSSLYRNEKEAEGSGIRGVVGVFDSDRTDARFLLLTLACEYEKIIWISCTPAGTEQNIKLAHKRSSGKSGTRSDVNDSKICVFHVMDEFAHIVEGESDHQTGAIQQEFAKKLLQRIKQDIDGCNECVTIVDDLSLLSLILGQKLSYGLVQCILAINPGNTIFRASLDVDQNALFTEIKGDWLDGIQDSTTGRLQTHGVWERSLIELCDTRIDVVPLESGFSREAHGRIIISNGSGCEALNYVCGDNGVRAIRMYKER